MNASTKYCVKFNMSIYYVIAQITLTRLLCEAELFNKVIRGSWKDINYYFHLQLQIKFTKHIYWRHPSHINAVPNLAHGISTSAYKFTPPITSCTFHRPCFRTFRRQQPRKCLLPVWRENLLNFVFRNKIVEIKHQYCNIEGINIKYH